MEIETFSILTGSAACNARCPYCVSKMTPNMYTGLPLVNYRNLRIACDLAEKAGATTAMITGKGEPLLFPSLVQNMISACQRFPLIELQTNGILIARDATVVDAIKNWFNMGLTTVAVSIVHWDAERNADIYTPGKETYDVEKLVDLLHDIGLSVRLCVTLLQGYVGDFAAVTEMIRTAKKWKVEQLTLTPVSAPETSRHEETKRWVLDHQVDVGEIQSRLFEKGKFIRVLPHGAAVLDVEGQNVCLNNCLGRPVNETIRNLVFFPDGHLRTDWHHEGSIIL